MCTDERLEQFISVLSPKTFSSLDQIFFDLSSLPRLPFIPIELLTYHFQPIMVSHYHYSPLYLEIYTGMKLLTL